MNLPSVSAVIPTHGRRDGLNEVVRAVGADPHVSEIVVVVDGSGDGSYELLQAMAESDRRIRPLWQENAGDAAARQTGVEHARGDVVLVLDDDVLAGPRLAEGHARVHAAAEGIVLLGHMPVNRPVSRRPGDFATLLYADEYERVCARYEADPESILTHLWLGNLSMRRADALKVGFVGPRRLGYHADQDFGLRCLRAGLTGRFDRTLAATHAHRRDLASFARLAWLSGADRRYLLENYSELFSHADLFGELPLPVRAVVGIAASPPAYRLTAPALRAGVRGAGRAGLWRSEMTLARLLRQVEVYRGFHGRR